MGAAEKLAAFEIYKESEYVLVRLSGVLEADTVGDFELKINDALKKPTHIIFNCEQLSGMSQTWMRVLMQVQKHTKTVNKKIRMINVSPEVKKFFREEGVDSSLKMSANLQSALLEINVITGSKVLNVDFINPFLTSTVNVLSIQATTKATVGKIYRKEANAKYLGDISGVIGLISDAFSGSVVISFPAETFLKIMSRMLGEECKEINKDIQDGAGELTNIIFGQAKIELNEKGFGIKTALPSVVSGADHSILQMTKGPRMVVPFESDAGPFFIEICLSV